MALCHLGGTTVTKGHASSRTLVFVFLGRPGRVSEDVIGGNVT
jgi:hypothetical protein